MCFSAAASFTVSAALLPAGGYCVIRALRSGARLRLLPLALTPLAFCVQQFSEGLVWLGLNSADPVLTRSASVVFLFFGIPFWPFWIALSMSLLDGRRGGRLFLGALALLSLAWAWLFFPVVVEPDRWLTTRVVQHSIQYVLDDLPAFKTLPRLAWRGAYLLEICAPLLVCRPAGAGQGGLRLVSGALVAGLFLICYFVFWYAFLSVWCFFAALVSLLLCWVFAKIV